jgi:predicted membrane protein
MLDHQGNGPSGAERASSQSGDRKTNTISDVENQLGFLFVGFGAILSFLGLRSAEVTTVLRNDATQASLIALLLLFGVLAAVLAVAIPNSEARKVSWVSATAIMLALFGVGALVIYAIPITAAPGIAPGILSKELSLILVPLGITILVIGAIIARIITMHKKTAIAEQKMAVAERKMAVAEEYKVRAEAKIALAEETGQHELRVKEEERMAQAEEKAARARGEERTAIAEEKAARAEAKIQPKKWYDWLLAPCIPLTVVFLLASVMFIAISTYGAIRLETDSQLSSSVQVAASVETTNSGTMISAHVTASKIEDGSWVGIDVVGLPSTVQMAAECENLQTRVKPNSATCLQDPCAIGPGYLGSQCKIVMGGTVVPDANGDVDETLNAPISSDEFQDIDVRAYICSPKVGCRSVNNTGDTNTSRLDIIIPTPSAS